MSQEKIYPKGIRVFPKNDNAPDFVLGRMIITPNELIKFLKQPDILEHKTEYKGETQFSFDILEAKDGSVYFTLNTYKSQKSEASNKPQMESKNTEDFPF